MAEKRALNFVCTQDLDSQNWNFSADIKHKIFTNDSVQTANRLLHYVYLHLQETFMAENELTKIKFAGILHNKDTAEVWDDINGCYATESKRDHIHFFVQFQHCTKKYLHTVAECIGVDPQYIEIPKGRYGVENSLAYLVHAKDESKYQYNPANVLTFDSMDYRNYYNKHRKNWNYYKATQLRKSNNLKKDWLIEQIQQCRVTKKQILLDKNYAPIYANNMVQINEAFTFYSEKQIVKSLSDFESHRFALTTIFITGKPRVGKTFLAKRLIKNVIQQIQEHYQEQWQVYQTAATNPLDDYAGEQILFLDDVRATSLTATDWLKLMDPINSSPISARYHNKQPASRVIIVTSYKSPEEFFGFMKGQSPNDESLDQFLGRLSFVVKVVDDNTARDSKRAVIGIIVHLTFSKSINITPTEEQSNFRNLSFLPKYQSKPTLPTKAIKFLTNKVIDNNDPSKKHIVKQKPLIKNSNQEKNNEKLTDKLINHIRDLQNENFEKYGGSE